MRCSADSPHDGLYRVHIWRCGALRLSLQRSSVCLLSSTTLTARGIRSWPSSSCRPRTVLATHDVQADEGTAAGRAGSSKAQETSCI